MLTNEIIQFWNTTQYVILPGKYMGEKYRYEYNAIFNFWQKQWADAFNEIKHNEQINQTEFCRHEEVTGLFLNGQIIAVALTDFLKTDCPVQSRHRNFENFSESILEQITQVSKNKPVRTVNYLAIDSKYRSNYYVADMVVGLTLLRTSELQNAVLIGHSRNTRKTNELGYRLGGIPLEQNVTVHGEPSDFMYFNTTSFEFIKNHILYSEMKTLWKNKIFHFSPQIEFYYKNNDRKQTQQKGIPNENNVTNSL